jgi:L-ascorbate metabolism protein UlaG (beta-lactamase superfamily)
MLHGRKLPLLGSRFVSTARAGELAKLHQSIPVERYRSLLGHWISRWFRPPAPARHEAVPIVQPGQVVVTFGGHATVLARYQQLSIAFDPMLGRWVGGVRRAVEPGLAPGDFDEVGLVLISHRHRDHLHVATLKKFPRRSATIVVPAGGAAWVSALGFARVVELQPGADLELRGIQVIAYATAHGDTDLARGISYVVRPVPDSGLIAPSLFLCGDSGYFSGFADIGDRFAPDIAMLPIGGFYPQSFRNRHMSPLDALYAFEDLRSRLLVPIHHGSFALSYERLGEPARWLLELATARGLRDHVKVMAPGQTEPFSVNHPAWPPMSRS